MNISINQELCDGCGFCVEACPNSAIYLSVGKAKIDDLLCTTCEACISLCPVEAIQEAIQKEPVSAPTLYIPTSSGVSGRDIQLSKPSVVQAPSRDLRSGSLLGRVGAALFALGREVLPYVADGMTAALEHRIASSRGPATTPFAGLSVRREASGVGWGAQQRRRKRVRRGRA